MPKVTIITRDDQKVIIPDACGTLMEAAQDNDVEGIDGDCGVVCSCSTGSRILTWPLALVFITVWVPTTPAPS
jgi:ferredoxin